MAGVVVAAGVVAIKPWTSPEAGAEQVGVAGDVVAAADYDGDGRTDRGVWRPGNGRWVWVSSANGHATETPGFGLAGDIPVPADYDGDGVVDRAVYRPSKGRWYLAQSSAGAVERFWGINGDIPVPGDYDGDGKADLVLYRPGRGTWHLAQSTGAQIERNWGINGDIPVPGDYDGDKIADLALYRPGQGHWHIAQSTGAQVDRNWGINGDIPAPGDYDRDGKSDLALYRPGDRNWHIYGIQPPAACSWEWPPGKVFAPGESFVDCQGDRFTFQTDGNVVQYDPAGQVTWASNVTAPGGRLEFQASNGNLVTYNAANQKVWESGVTAPGGVLKFEALGNVVVYNNASMPVWAHWDAKSDKKLDDLARKVAELERKLAEAQAKQKLNEEKFQKAIQKIDELERQVQLVQAALKKPDQPCVSGADVAKASIEAVAAVVAILLTRGATSLAPEWLATTVALTETETATVSWVDIVRKCTPWSTLLEFLRGCPTCANPESFGISAYVTPGPTGPELAFGNRSLAELPNGMAAAVWGEFWVDGESEGTLTQSHWRVDYRKDPRTPANTIVGTPIEIERNGVHGTLFTMGNGDTIFMPVGNPDMSILYERDNSTGRSTQTIYDEDGNYVITVDSELGMVNVNDMWNGDNVYGMGVNANIFWGWGMIGFGGWSSEAGGGTGGDGGCLLLNKLSGKTVCLFNSYPG